MFEQRLAQVFICREQRVGCLTVRCLERRVADFDGQVPARLAERLVAGAALLAVPHRLVDDVYRRQYRNLLETEDEVGQVRDGTVTVLEVEGIQELLGLLRAQLADGLQHALARSRVLGQRIGLHFGWTPATA